MRTDIRYLADIQSMTARHTDVDLNRLINESWQRFREKVSDVGNHLYLTPATGTMTAGPLAGYGFGSIAWPAGAVRVYGIDVTVAANDIRSLDYVQWSQRNEYMSTFGSTNGTPLGFHVYSIGAESTTTVAAGAIGIYPAPDRAYPYAVWHLPAWVDISNDTYVFNGHAGWEKWVAWDCVLAVTARDNDMQNCAAIATQERDRVWATILSGASTIQRVGPTKRVDSAGRARGYQLDARWRRT